MRNLEDVAENCREISDELESLSSSAMVLRFDVINALSAS